MNPEPVLDRIADAILDGAPVDWSLLETNDATGPRDRVLIEQLKTLETLRGRLRMRHAEAVHAWGHLKVFERVGQGAYGDVYRAWDSRLDREVALKLLPLEPASPESPDSTIIEEGRLIARVRHPNVVTVYGAERIDGRVGLWMEFVKGRTLEQSLKEARKYTAAEAVTIGVTLARAVAAVHEAGLLHRDIKAHNVMVDDQGRLVLMDFGTGRELEQLGAADSGRIAGTPLYLAPEVLEGGAATPQSDVYSVGVVLFRLLTNDYPVKAPTLGELKRLHAGAGSSDGRVDRPEIPPRLWRVLARALDPNPARRFAGAAELASALQATTRTPGSRRALYSVAAVATALLAGVAGWNLGLRERLSPSLIAWGVMKAPTIAVLPFKDAGSDPGHDGFIDGLTSEVISDLANIDGLRVTGQDSSFHFKNRPDSPGDAGTQLRADFVVEAKVQRVGNRLRIDAQLFRVRDAVVVFSQSYDRTIDDVFAIQEDLARQIVDKVRLRLGGQRRYQTTAAAYDLYLHGRTLALRGGTKNAEAAVQAFQQVIAMDDSFTPAHAGLAGAYAAWAWQPDGISNDVAVAAMRRAAERALERDPTLSEAHLAMALTLARERDWEGSRQAFEQAIQYKTNLSETLQRYAFSTLLPMGEFERAEELAARAVELDPLSPTAVRELGTVYYVQGRYDEAIACFKAAQAADITFGSQMLARALAQSGRSAEALQVFESRPANRGWERWILPAYIREGRSADVARLTAENEHDLPHRQAILYAALGDKDRTFDALNRTIETLPQRVAIFIRWPEFALLRGDERLGELERRLNLR